MDKLVSLIPALTFLVVAFWFFFQNSQTFKMHLFVKKVSLVSGIIPLRKFCVHYRIIHLQRTQIFWKTNINYPLIRYNCIFAIFVFMFSIFLTATPLGNKKYFFSRERSLPKPYLRNFWSRSLKLHSNSNKFFLHFQ